MRGFGAFLGKEVRETVHTWRIWVLPGFILFAALSSPIITFLMPTLADRLGSMPQGFAISVPDPSALAAYIEYLHNLGELVMFALVIAYGGIVSSEVRAGTAALALAKPLSRRAFVLAKWLSQVLVIAVAAVAATAVCVAVTAVLLGVGPAPDAVAAVALWFVYATMFLSAMVLLSSVLPAPAAAAGAGIGVYASLAILAQFEATSRMTPAGLMPAADAVLSGEPAYWQMPVATGIALSVACLAAAVWRFSRREI
jgi:ABC-type transport system involved in multi-copper enzyme maturation permease subunit